MRTQTTVAVSLACLLVGGGIGWAVGQAGDDDSGNDTGWVASLDDVWTDPAAQYRFTQWWTDGTNALRLIPGDDGVMLTSALAYESTREPIVDGVVRLPGTGGDETMHIAGLPGSDSHAWLALTQPDPNAEQPPTIRPAAWTSVDGSDPVRTELPVDLSSDESNGRSATVDGAVALVDQTPGALVVVSQSETVGDSRTPLARAVLACADLTACDWQPVNLPDADLDIASVASTGQGYVIGGSTETTHQLWYADAADLEWTQVRESDVRPGPVLLQDGDRQVVVVDRAPREDDEDRRFAVSIIDDSGTITEEVESTATPDITRVEAALRDAAGTWWLGGSRTAGAEPNFQLPYTADQPSLVRFEDGAWRNTVDELMANQADQTIRAIVPADADSESRELELASSSSVLRVIQLWGLTLDDE